MDKDDELDSRLNRLDLAVDRDRTRIKDDNRLKLVETVFDDKTRLLLFGMINRGLFTSIEGTISTGKEANVYYAQSATGAVAIKIYRLKAPSFRRMRQYVEGDFRFKRFRSTRAGFIEAWAKKEFKNLSRMVEHGIPCPKPIYVEQNILLLEYLGTEEAVLPPLRDVTPTKPHKLYKQVMASVRDLYKRAGLVHGDLSEYNLLFDEATQSYYIIDVSQAVLVSHPKAMEFLLRDLSNMNSYFSSLNIPLITLDVLFEWVTGEKPDPVLLHQVEQ